MQFSTQSVVNTLKVAAIAGAALFATSAFAADKLMVTETVQLNAAPAKVWDAIKDFDKWSTWHPAVASTKIASGGANAVGTVRVLSLNGGGEINETLTKFDAATMSFGYAINTSPLPVANYASTVAVTKSGEGSLITWSSSFEAKGTPDADAKKLIGGVYRAGLDNLKKMMP